MYTLQIGHKITTFFSNTQEFEHFFAIFFYFFFETYRNLSKAIFLAHYPSR